MKEPHILIISIFLIFLVMPFVSSAHFIVGIVNNARDGENANGKTVVLWDPANGEGDNITDIVGPSGNSNANNIYLFDCELLSNPCEVGDEVRVKVLNNGDDYISNYVNLTVTGAGFDEMQNITMNSIPAIINIVVDDSISSPSGEIDLNPATTTLVNCSGVIREYDGNETLVNVTAEFFDNIGSFFGDGNDNNDHYSNNSCSLDLGYGAANEASFSCTYNVEYYANSSNWNCTVSATDNFSISCKNDNLTFINSLLALSVPSPINFGEINSTRVSSESEINVTNVGNAQVNLSLSGYGASVGDGLAMNCSLGTNISVENAKFNLTASNFGNLNLGEVEANYTNLSSSPIVRKYDLDFRHNDLVDDAFNSTYWRMYVPKGSAGNCSGNVVFGAVISGGS